MKFGTIFLDIDNTLFDFKAASFHALQKTFAEFGKPTFTHEEFLDYDEYNTALWVRFEKGEITKDFIFSERFRQYFAACGYDFDIEAFNRSYLYHLSEGHELLPHAEELVKTLYGKCSLYILTNGDAFSQQRRVREAGLEPYFDKIFISEQMGTRKPEKRFFDLVFAEIGEEKRQDALMVGDSLSSDMQGGRNAGIQTCFYGAKSRADDRCDYVIEDLLDLLDILEIQ